MAMLNYQRINGSVTCFNMLKHLMTGCFQSAIALDPRMLIHEIHGPSKWMHAYQPPTTILLGESEANLFALGILQNLVDDGCYDDEGLPWLTCFFLGSSRIIVPGSSS